MTPLLLAMLMGLRGQFFGATAAPLGGLAGTPVVQSSGSVPLFSSFGALLRGQINPEFRSAFAAGLRQPAEVQRPPLAELVARGDPRAIAIAQARAESAARGTRIDALMDALNQGLFAPANTEFLVPAPRGPRFRDPFTQYSM